MYRVRQKNLMVYALYGIENSQVFLLHPVL